MSDIGQGMGQGTLSVTPEAQLQKQDAAAANANMPQQAEQDPTQLIGYIKGQFEIFRNHRNTASGWSDRLLNALRTSKGQYDAQKLNEIRRFGGSDVFIRMIAQKNRAASSLLRDIYLGADIPWTIRPSSNPDIPPEILQSIDQLMQAEGQQIQQTHGQPPKPSDVQNRKTALLESATLAAKKKACFGKDSFIMHSPSSSLICRVFHSRASKDLRSRLFQLLLGPPAVVSLRSSKHLSFFGTVSRRSIFGLPLV
jgi:hypothetical protein